MRRARVAAVDPRRHRVVRSVGRQLAWRGGHLALLASELLIECVVLKVVEVAVGSDKGRVAPDVRLRDTRNGPVRGQASVPRSSRKAFKFN